MTVCTFSFSPRSQSGIPLSARNSQSYRILSFSVQLSPPDTWHTSFTLSRIISQPSLLPALHIPTSDQLDDWKDYQRLKLIDDGDDFAMLHEILAQGEMVEEEMGDGYSMKNRRHGSEDSGYFSRRGSKAISTGDGKRDSILTQEMGGIAEDVEMEDEAEEADDEGVVAEELVAEDGSSKGGLNRKGHDYHGIAQPSVHPQIAKPEHLYQVQPQTRIGTRFISPRKPAEPRLSADDDAVVARRRDVAVVKQTGKGAPR